MSNLPKELLQIIEEEAAKLQKKSIDLAAGKSKAYGFRLGCSFLYGLIDGLVTEIEEKKRGEEERNTV